MTRPIAMRATMYFAYAGKARAGLVSRTTFDAILAGERTSTTRFPQWPGHERWARLAPGDVIRLFADRDMSGRHVDVEVVESPSTIDLATCAADALEAWSLAEGWSAAAGRDFGRRYGKGLQLRYRHRGLEPRRGLERGGRTRLRTPLREGPAAPLPADGRMTTRDGRGR